MPFYAIAAKQINLQSANWELKRSYIILTSNITRWKAPIEEGGVSGFSKNRIGISYTQAHYHGKIAFHFIKNLLTTMFCFQVPKPAMSKDEKHLRYFGVTLHQGKTSVQYAAETPHSG